MRLTYVRRKEVTSSELREIVQFLLYAGVFLCGYYSKESVYKAMTAKRPYEGKAGELTWLCSIAKNLAIDECRKNKKFSELDETLPQQTADLADKVSDTDSVLQIHMVLHELPEPYKEVFQLRVFGELTFAQIGMVFGKTENWARVTYHRARLKIKERID